MLFLFTCGLVALHLSAQRGNPLLRGVDSQQTKLQSGGNMEGKEVRFGVGGSTLTVLQRPMVLRDPSMRWTTVSRRSAGWFF
jgi:K+-transporting ATPase A subunit